MVTTINSRANAEEEGRKKSWQQDEESCSAVPGSVGSVLDAETIQGTGNFHLHTQELTQSG